MKETYQQLIRQIAVTLGLAALGAIVQAQPVGHYAPGLEGIKAASLPPAGLYFKDYNYFYASDRYNGPSGDEIAAADLNLRAYVNAVRAIWISPWKILGADYGADVILPFFYTDAAVTVGPGQRLEHSTFELGDIAIEPLVLSWHGARWDAAAGYCVWVPIGNPRFGAGGNKGFWSSMFTLGGTYYTSEDKTWAISILNRYEIHTEYKDVTRGDSFTLEGGVSKSLSKSVDLGLIGYFQQQVSADSGPGTSDDLASVYGIGPEISVFCSKLGLFTSLRYVHEFGAENRAQGDTVTLTLTRRF